MVIEIPTRDSEPDTLVHGAQPIVVWVCGAGGCNQAKESGGAPARRSGAQTVEDLDGTGVPDLVFGRIIHRSELQTLGCQLSSFERILSFRLIY